jgi:outer membrane lipoprotein carrier protein
VSLRPTNTDSGFTSVELGFDGDTLMSMVFQDNLKQTTLVNLSGVVVNEPIGAECFRFDVPDGVDLVGTPAGAEVAGP